MAGALFALSMTGARAQTTDRGGLPPVIVVGAFSQLAPGAGLPSEWKPLAFSNVARATRYELAADPAVGTVVKATAEASASGLTREIDIDPARHPILRWRWRVDALPSRSDVLRKEGDDYGARIYVTFAYDPGRVPWWLRAKVELIRLLYGRYPPHAGLNYIWATRTPVGTEVPNPFTDRVHMIVVDSGTGRLGQWIAHERNVAEDYRRAFGEDPPRISGIAIMTDTDNTGESATAWYGDIEVAATRRAAP